MSDATATSSSTREVSDLLRVELDRVLTRLAHLGPARLSRPATGGAGAGGLDAAGPDAAAPTGGRSAADLVRETLQPLADAVAEAAGQPRRTVPVLADRAVADQLAVLGADALDATLPQAALADLAQRLTALRRALP